MTSEVYYYVGHVRTKFEEWLGCATKYCEGHKKNKQICHIRPETTIYAVGNGLYECIDCHQQYANSRQGDFWTVKDQMPYLGYDATMSQAEADKLHDHLQALREALEKGNIRL